MPPLVSVITCALNQGDWVRDTIPRIRTSLGNWPHEMLVVDDQSIDGCCHGLDQDTTVIRTPTRHGVTSSRRLAVRAAEGEVYLFTDPHCHYPGNALRDLVAYASDKEAICIAATSTLPKVSRIRNGGKLTVSDRGLKVSYSFRHPAPYPALLGTIYAVKKEIYEQTGGWPELPGVWGYAEQAWTLASWFAGVPIWVMPGHACNHQHYHPKEGTKFSYRVPLSHQAQNGHWIHASFFPKTYESKWKPLLLKRFKNKPDNITCLQKKGWDSKEPGVGRRKLKDHRLEIAQRAIRTEEDFFEMILGERMLVHSTPLDEEFVAKQRKRSKPNQDYDNAHGRQDRAVRWFIKNVPGCIKGLSILDLGTRSGYVLDLLKEYGVRNVEGVEVVPETAEWARDTLKRNVINADMRNTPYKDNEWHRVLCIHAMEHVPDPDAVMKEIMRILIPGGWFMIVVPVEETLSHRYAHYSNFRKAQDLLDIVSRYEVEITHHETMELLDDKTGKFEILLLGKKPSVSSVNSLISEPEEEVSVEPEPEPKPEAEVVETPEVENSAVDQQRERCKTREDYRKWSWRIKRALNWLTELIPQAYEGKTVLDLGTRDGYALVALKDRGATTVQGIELVPEVAEWASKELKRDVIVGDICELPYGDNTWDTVTCIHSLEHTSNALIAVHEIVRVLKPGGFFLINVPRERRLNKLAAHNINFPNPQVLEIMTINTDAVVIKVQEVFSLPPKDGVQPGRMEILLAGRKRE